VPQIARYKKFYLGRTDEINVLYARSIMGGYLIVFDNKKKIISVRKINWLEFLRLKMLK